MCCSPHWLLATLYSGFTLDIQDMQYLGFIVIYWCEPATEVSLGQPLEITTTTAIPHLQGMEDTDQGMVTVGAFISCHPLAFQ